MQQEKPGSVQVLLASAILSVCCIPVMATCICPTSVLDLAAAVAAAPSPGTAVLSGEGVHRIPDYAARVNATVRDAIRASAISGTTCSC
jgi:hypothetical protein